jgi:hypothetical protein
MELNRPGELAAQERYAKWLAWGTRVGLALLVASFALYLFGVAAPHVPIERLPELWRMPASELMAQTQLHPGWGWAALLPRGDMLVLAAMAILSTCSALCIAAVIPIFKARGERAFVAICVLTIVVLLVAASGLLARH